MSDLCPCGSGIVFESCCEPYLIEREKPATAAALMRSRYSAYALGAVDYLYKTSGPKVRKEFDAESSRKWAESATWTGIEILEETGGHTDQTGRRVIAHYSVKGLHSTTMSAPSLKRSMAVAFIDGTSGPTRSARARS